MLPVHVEQNVFLFFIVMADLCVGCYRWCYHYWDTKSSCPFLNAGPTLASEH